MICVCSLCNYTICTLIATIDSLVSCVTGLIVTIIVRKSLTSICNREPLLYYVDAHTVREPDTDARVLPIPISGTCSLQKCTSGLFISPISVSVVAVLCTEIHTYSTHAHCLWHSNRFVADAHAHSP